MTSRLPNLRALRGGSIESPPRANRSGSAAILLVVGAYAASGPLGATGYSWLVAASLATLLGLLARSAPAVQAGLLALIYFGVLGQPRLAGLWPLPLVIILVVYALAVGSWPWLRCASGWLRWGRLDRTTWVLVACCVGASAIALIAWRFWTDADLTPFRRFVPAVPWWTIPIGLLVFAALNAAFEEIIWRGVLMDALEAAIGPGWLVWLLQGLAFGLWHYAGFPRGWVGVGLATIFALMLGALRMRSRGMVAPWVAHLFADVTIFVLVAVMVLAP